MPGRRTSRCCCGGECVIYSDFDLPNDFATQWDEETGAWTWTGGTGILTADSDGSRLISTSSQLYGGNGVHYLRVSLTGTGVVQAIVDWADSSNYTYVEVSTGAAYFKLFRVSGGSSTQYGGTIGIPPVDYYAGSPYTLNIHVCRQTTNVVAWLEITGAGPGPMTEAIPRFQEAVSHNNGGKIGIKVVSGYADIELFDLYWTFEATVNTAMDCETCGGCTYCVHNETTPNTVKVVIAGSNPIARIGSDCNNTGCALWKATHFLTLGFPASASGTPGCMYYKYVDISAGGANCGGFYLPKLMYFWRTINASNHYLAVASVDSGGGGEARYAYDFGTTKPDCAFTDYGFTLQYIAYPSPEAGGDCEWTLSTTVTVTY